MGLREASVLPIPPPLQRIGQVLPKLGRGLWPPLVLKTSLASQHCPHPDCERGPWQLPFLATPGSGPAGEGFNMSCMRCPGPSGLEETSPPAPGRSRASPTVSPHALPQLWTFLCPSKQKNAQYPDILLKPPPATSATLTASGAAQEALRT